MSAEEVGPLHFDPTWLRRKYVDEGLTTVEIGRIVHRDPKGIWTQLRRFGIPTRSRGFYLRAGPKGHNYMLQPGAVNPFLGRTHTPEVRSILSWWARRPKPHLRGSGNGMFGVHGPSHPAWKGGVTPERQRFYHTLEWKAAAHLVYRRDRMKCRRCGSSTNPPNPKPHLHHIVTFADESKRMDPDNIVLLCQTCHWWVHSRKNAGREFLGEVMHPYGGRSSD